MKTTLRLPACVLLGLLSLGTDAAPASTLRRPKPPPKLAHADEPADSPALPKLPTLSSMLGSSSAALKSFRTKASVLEARAMEMQRQSEARLARQRKAFDQKLRKQEESNQDIVAANWAVSRQIAVLKRNCSAIRKHSDVLRNSNSLMRKELHMLETKLDEARLFVSQTLTLTDDSSSKELAVLQVHHVGVRNATVTDKPGQTDSSEDDAEGEDEEARRSRVTSLLEVERQHRKQGGGGDESSSVNDVAHADETPETLIKILSDDIAHLAADEQQSAAQLKAIFISDFQSGIKRRRLLLQQQTTLNSTRTELQQHQEQLHAAEHHLEDTRGHLVQRIHELGLLVQRIAHLALAPPAEVERILKAPQPSTVEKVHSPAVAA